MGRVRHVKCAKCGKYTRVVLGITLPHICRYISPVTRANSFTDALLNSASTNTDGVGPGWAPLAYGDYYPRSSLIYSAIKLRAESITRPKLKLYRTSADHTNEEVNDHPLVDLLERVNPWWTMSDLWTGTETYLGLWGSCFWVKTDEDRLPSNNPKQLWLTRPDRVRIIPDSKGYIAGFLVGEGKSRVSILPDEMVWFRYFNPLDELAGLSPIAPLRLGLNTSLEVQKHNFSVFRNGPMADSAITTEETPTDEEIDEFYARLRKRLAGTENSHLPIVLSAGMDVKSVGMTSRDLEFMATLRWSLEEVCRVYGIPKILLQDMEHATFNNTEHAERIFWRNTMVPHLIFLQEEVNEMLIKTVDPFLHAAFDLSDIEALGEDATVISDRDRKDIEAGVLTINEVRGGRGLASVSWGDSWWVDIRKVPISDTETDPDQLPPEDLEDLEDGEDEDREYPNGTYPGTPAGTHIGIHKSRRPTDRVFQSIVLKQFGAGVPRFEKLHRDLFGIQKVDVLRRLRSIRDISSIESIEYSVKQMGEVVFDAADWNDLFIERGSPLFLGNLEAGARGVISAFGLGFAFDSNNPVVRDWVAASTRLWSQLVNQETAILLMEEIQAGINLGESIPQITSRVEKVFAFNDLVRAERIARTQVIGAVNSGHQFAYEQSGVVERKRWIATHDDRVRSSHLATDGQIVNLHDTFSVGGFPMMYPGDLNAPASETVNCRCTTAPVLSQPKKFTRENGRNGSGNGNGNGGGNGHRTEYVFGYDEIGQIISAKEL